MNGRINEFVTVEFHYANGVGSPWDVYKIISTFLIVHYSWVLIKQVPIRG